MIGRSEMMLILNSLAVLLGTLLCGAVGLPLLRRLHVGQTVRDDGPKSHFSKTGTPTFGGLFFLLPLALSAIVMGLLTKSWLSYAVIVFLMLLFALIGFRDDYVKVRIDREGLSVRQKTAGLALICILFGIWFIWFSGIRPVIYLPFVREPWLISGWLRYVYLVFIVLYLFFVSNAVNISDGIDGLSSSLTIICSASLAVSIYFSVRSEQERTPLIGACLAIAAGCLGFLYFNRHPARVFMGDTGSQALGAGIAGIALLAGIPWVILFAGVVYVAEALSTLIQVYYYRKTGGKRLFRMAPLHHHFELGGWSEAKVLRIFSAAGLLGGLLGIVLTAV